MTKRCERFELTIRILSHMLHEIINQRMEQTGSVILRPVFTFEFVAGVTSINQIGNIILALLRLRPKMVTSQLRADL